MPLAWSSSQAVLSCLYDRHDDPVVAAVYDMPNECWNLQALAQLIVRYENESQVLGALDLDTWNRNDYISRFAAVRGRAYLSRHYALAARRSDSTATASQKSRS